MKKRIMLKTLWIFIICLYAENIQQQDIKYPQDGKHKLQYSNGMPTTLGINLYVNSQSNQKKFIKEYQTLIKDSIYNDMYFRTEFVKSSRSALAYNVISLNHDCEIVVSNNERYRALEYSDSLKDRYTEDDCFVKSTVFHEISHYYFAQVMLEMMKVKHLSVNEYYSMDISLIPNQELQYGSKFIEEGFCEYVIQKFHLCPYFINIPIPVRKSDLDDKRTFDFQYVYSSTVLKNYLDSCITTDGSIKRGLMIILTSRPPNYNEMLKPRYYFQRLKKQTLTPLPAIDSIY